MAKVILKGWARPDDPIYKSGPVVGGKRFYGKPASPPKAHLPHAKAVNEEKEKDSE